MISEEWGGQNIFVPVSARTGDGVDKLLEAILLQAEVLELRAPVTGLASGVVIESSIEKGRGAVATVLVKKGTLHVGDPIIAGSEFGRVRAMFDESGKPVQEAPPSMPVVVLGLSAAPNAGDEILAAESERKAREVALYRQGKFRDVKLARQTARPEDVFSQLGEAKAGVVAVLIKADVQGSAEALQEALSKLSTEEVQVKVIAAGLGGITESDVQLAAASKALIIGFNVRADAGAREAVKETGVEVRYYSIIYNAIDDVKQMMTGMLQPEIKEQIVGVAQVREVFRSSKFGVVAGCLVVEGLVKRNNPIRVLRDNVVIFEGALESLRRFKDDVAKCAPAPSAASASRTTRTCASTTRSSASRASRWPARCHERGPQPSHRVRDPARAGGADRARGQGPARRQRHHHGGEPGARHEHGARVLHALRLAPVARPGVHRPHARRELPAWRARPAVVAAARSAADVRVR